MGRLGAATREEPRDAVCKAVCLAEEALCRSVLIYVAKRPEIKYTSVIKRPELQNNQDFFPATISNSSKLCCVREARSLPFS